MHQTTVAALLAARPEFQALLAWAEQQQVVVESLPVPEVRDSDFGEFVAAGGRP